MPAPVRLLLPVLCLLAPACGGLDDQRVRELWAEKGFGSRADGVADYENFVASGDGVVFLVDPVAMKMPGAEQLFLLSRPQQVGIDGTISVPYVGSVPVLGKTEAELTALVRDQLQPLFTFEIELQARIINRGKAFYAIGEFVRKGRIPMQKGDITLIEAVTTLGVTPMGNVGKVRVIYPDAQDPLVVTVNVREMMYYGHTGPNVPIHNNTILYMPPTFLGGISRFLERILLPLRASVGALFGLARIRASYDILTGDSDRIFFRF